jgi:hypothetical protein
MFPTLHLIARYVARSGNLWTKQKVRTAARVTISNFCASTRLQFEPRHYFTTGHATRKETSAGCPVQTDKLIFGFQMQEKGPISWVQNKFSTLCLKETGIY